MFLGWISRYGRSVVVVDGGANVVGGLDAVQNKKLLNYQWFICNATRFRHDYPAVTGQVQVNQYNYLIVQPRHLFAQLKQSKSLSEHVIGDKHFRHLIFIQFDSLTH